MYVQVLYLNEYEDLDVLDDYIKMYNSCFPVKTIKVGYKTKKSWLSEELKKAIKIKSLMCDQGSDRGPFRT